MSTATREETAVLALDLVQAKPLAVQANALAVNSPVSMMLQAMAQGASLEQVEKMMALQERWEASEARKAYNAAFASFKAEAIRVVKNRDVTDGPLRGKSYAELFSVVDAVTPALSRNGLSASWKLTKDDKDWLEITCTLKHSAGHSETVSMGGPPDAGGAKSAIQARASAITYLERYTLKAITGVAEGGDDNDGAGSPPPANDSALLDEFRAKAMNGTDALREHYAAKPPHDAFWAQHAKSLKAAAKKADEAAQ